MDTDGPYEAVASGTLGGDLFPWHGTEPVRYRKAFLYKLKDFAYSWFVPLHKCHVDPPVMKWKQYLGERKPR